ncbi:cation efflux protein [Aulographum hederae CBS 113979]|uniref:Cation efflux protein n=1 Tax=Aulographum hederae CBS 113979 TaxID=1176131 RepID=A0A6G1HHA0_9PEZI|nr:cation efflux protein [Aulographum hederae CBS 113979]
MGLSKLTRMSILLGIDSVFFLAELVIGTSTHSLALIADSFHMLNDVLSLCVGLWAISVAQSKAPTKNYTYGFQRAETLGALVNGVFLVALCLSIFIDAITRFFEPQVVANPVLVLIVGCVGLASNIVGLFLFHDHGHSHGHGDEGHGHKSDVHAAEEGQNTMDIGHNGEARVVGGGEGESSQTQHLSGKWPVSHSSEEVSDSSTLAQTSSNMSFPKRHHRKTNSRSRNYSGLDEIPVHPGSFRNNIIAASRLEDVDSGSGTDTESEQAIAEEEPSNENSPLLKRAHRKSTTSDTHKSHKHAQPQQGKDSGHGHSHADLNMRGVFLHVMGDALGNIGVIASGLFIWKTDFSWRFYADPAISLVITAIILASAIPLCKAASRILLQAVPSHINVDEVRDDIELLPGIIGCHHLHVWQLSDKKSIASLHVQVRCDFQNQGSAEYMKLAKDVRKCLHAYGIHSSTIQPEFCLDDQHDHMGFDGSTRSEAGSSSQQPSLRSLRVGPDACMLECGDECGNWQSCCAPSKAVDVLGDSHAGHDH